MTQILNFSVTVFQSRIVTFQMSDQNQENIARFVGCHIILETSVQHAMFCAVIVENLDIIGVSVSGWKVVNIRNQCFLC